MSAIIVAGNEIIPDTLTVTVDGTEITAKDFQKVLLNINQASATASVADGTDLMQKMEIINKNANACDVSFTGKGGATVKNLKQNQSMRLSWTGSFWYVTFGGLLSGVANDGTPFNYTTEVTLDEVPVNTTYTTTEQDTGMTWIDGKKIYRKVLQWSGTIGNELNVLLFSIYSVDSIVRYEPFIKSIGDTVLGLSATAYVPSAANYTAVIGAFSGDTLHIRVNNGGTNNLTITFVQLILEYTKTTD